MFSLLIAVVMAIVLLGAVVLVYINRASSDVVGAALPVAGAALSGLALVFAFNRPIPTERSFAVLLLGQRADKQPVSVGYRAASDSMLALFSKAISENPELLKDPRFDDIGAGPLYHHLLQKGILEWISFRYSGTWRVRSEVFRAGWSQERFSGLPDASETKSTILSEEDLKTRLQGNVFASTSGFGFGKLALPYGTELTVLPPQIDSRQGEISEIRFRNPFVDFKIRTMGSMWGVGLAGYTPLVGLTIDESQDRYWHKSFVVRLEASYSTWRRGHPEMPLHREWVEGIVEGLAREFDEEAIWRRTMENLTLRHFSADSIRIPPGPMRYQKPATPQ